MDKSALKIVSNKGLDDYKKKNRKEKFLKGGGKAKIEIV